jgi:esterase/lipase
MKYPQFVTDKFGHKLEVLQEIPSKGDKFPTILLVPGFGADLHEYGYFDDISNVLLRNGFQTLRFSFEGCGQSEGDFVNMTIDKQSQQIHDMVDFIKQDRFTNIRRIGLLAQSFGGPTTVVAMPFLSIKSFIFTSFPPDPLTTFSKRFKRQKGYDPEGISKRERSDNVMVKIGPQFWKNLSQHNFYEEIKKMNKPMFFIHGGKDDIVKASQTAEFFETLNVSNKKIEILKMANHGFSGKYRPKVLKMIADWFLDTV